VTSADPTRGLREAAQAIYGFNSYSVRLTRRQAIAAFLATFRRGRRGSITVSGRQVSGIYPITTGKVTVIAYGDGGGGGGSDAPLIGRVGGGGGGEPSPGPTMGGPGARPR
jgi:hypothetical protein